MGTRQTIGGRSSCLLYLGALGALTLVVVLAVIVFIVAPERERQQRAEEQRARATATAEAKTAEILRAYGAGVAFAAAGDWERAAEEFGKVVALEPEYKDAATRLNEARASAKEATYQRGLGYFNLKHWEQAKVEFERVMAVDPNFKDVQANLAEVEARLAELTPTATPTPKATATPTPTATRVIITPSVVDFQWVGMDADRVSPGSNARPDGSKDGHFHLVLNLPSSTEITSIAIYSSDADGKPAGGQVWHSKDSRWWVLGVVHEGLQINLSYIASLGRFSGEAGFDLYGSNSGWFRQGNHFLVEIELSDGSRLRKVVTVA